MYKAYCIYDQILLNKLCLSVGNHTMNEKPSQSKTLQTNVILILKCQRKRDKYRKSFKKSLCASLENNTITCCLRLLLFEY